MTDLEFRNRIKSNLGKIVIVGTALIGISKMAEAFSIAPPQAKTVGPEILSLPFPQITFNGASSNLVVLNASNVTTNGVVYQLPDPGASGTYQLALATGFFVGNADGIDLNALPSNITSFVAMATTPGTFGWTWKAPDPGHINVARRGQIIIITAGGFYQNPGAVNLTLQSFDGKRRFSGQVMGPGGESNSSTYITLQATQTVILTSFLNTRGSINQWCWQIASFIAIAPS